MNMLVWPRYAPGSPVYELLSRTADSRSVSMSRLVNSAIGEHGGCFGHRRDQVCRSLTLG